MRGQGVGENQYVVKVDETKQKISKDLVNHSPEGLGSLPEAKREVEELKESKGSDDGSLRNIGGPHWNLEITRVPGGQVWKKNLEHEILAEKSEPEGRRYLSVTVVVLRRRKSPQGLQFPSGLGTM